MLDNSAADGDALVIADVLRRHAAERGDKPAYVFLDHNVEPIRTFTYAELDRRARAVGAELVAAGATNGRCLILHVHEAEFIVALLGCFYARAVAVPLTPVRSRRARSRVARIVRDCDAGFALGTDHDFAWLTEGDGGEFEDIQLIASADVPDAAVDVLHAPEVNAGTVAILQYTSGSTAHPRGVVLTHANLIANAKAQTQAMGQHTDSVVACWLPLNHDMGLIAIIVANLFVGATCYVMSPLVFAQSPLRWLQAITRFGATLTGGPNFAYDLCARVVTDEERDRLDLSTLETLFCGAEQVRKVTMDAFVQRFTSCGLRASALYPCYGLAESTVFTTGGDYTAEPVTVSFDKSELERGRAVTVEPTDPEARDLVGCGFSWRGERLAIVDPETRAIVDEGAIGEIWFSGPSVAQGYWNREEESTEVFRAHTADDPDTPYLRTGDVGFMHGGQLYIVSRMADLIVVWGRNIYPDDVELAVQEGSPAFRSGAGAAFAIDRGATEGMVMIQEVYRTARDIDTNVLLLEARRAITSEFEMAPAAVVLVRDSSLPRTSSGKIQRRRCRELYLSDELKILAAWPDPPPK